MQPATCLATPPPGYIPAELAVTHYHFARPSLIAKAREGSLEAVRVTGHRLTGAKWVYYRESDIRRLWLARQACAHGGRQARYPKLPPWIARSKTYPVPPEAVVTRLVREHRARSASSARAR